MNSDDRTKKRIHTRNDHGTGCTLSSAIAAFLAKGNSLEESVGAAKAYITKALEAGAAYVVGKGRGPVHHFHD
ncbi:MAG: bifunctional hydroxymethylpyrimidine kinase/phosphomethylpyrimidine kinase, partial [Deltaproteobacteria bacterium]